MTTTSNQENFDEVLTLLAEKAKSDTDAFGQLYGCLFSKLFAFIQYKVDTTEAEREDIVSEIFHKVLERLHLFHQERGSFGAWFFTLATNHIRDRFRKKKHVVVDLEDVPEIAGSDNLHERLMFQEENKQLLTALRTLPEREQNILSLKFGCGYTNRVIASMTNLTADNIGIIVYRSLQQLRNYLQLEQFEH